MTGTDRGAHCAECGEWHPADGETAGPTGGRFLCVDCLGDPVVFVGECIDCDWTYRYSGRSSDRYAVKQRVQQEKNNHETTKQEFEDESHETVWREVEPNEAERENPVLADGGQVEDGTERNDPVQDVLDELDRLDTSHDPTVAIFRHQEAMPVVAKVGDDLRLLSSSLIYAREIDVEDVRVAWDKQGEPDLVALSTQSHRFDASDFREVADLE